MFVGVEKGLVILALESRRHEALITCSAAERLVEALRKAAGLLDGLIPPKVLGEAWGCQVESYDGYVAFKFDPPTVGAPKRVPLPALMALKLADLIEFKMQQAKYKMRFAFTNGAN